MQLTWKNAPHLRKCGTLQKIRNFAENTAHLEKCAALKKMQHTWKNEAT